MKNVTLEQLIHEVAKQPELVAVLSNKPEEFGARFDFSEEQAVALKSADVYRPMKPTTIKWTAKTGMTI